VVEKELSCLIEEELLLLKLLMMLLVDYFSSSHAVAVWIFLAVVVIPLFVVKCPHRSRYSSRHHPHHPVDHHRILILLSLVVEYYAVHDHYVHERRDVVDEY